MKYVYIFVQKSFYTDVNHVDRMTANCFEEPKVFSSFDKAKSSLIRNANFYTQRGWANEWSEVSMSDIREPAVCFARKAQRADRDGRYVFYIIKSKVNYFDY